MTQLLLVEDHVLVRQSIRAFLEDAGITVIGETGTGTEALELLKTLTPNIVLLDVHLPEMNGIDVARYIRQHYPHIHIIVLTAYNEKAYQRALHAIGIHDFILKTAEFSELLRTIQNVTQPTHEPTHNMSLDSPSHHHLTEREIEVLQAASRGLTNKQIGHELGISARTVQVHLYTIYQKLNAANRTEAVLRALSLNLITPIQED